LITFVLDHQPFSLDKDDSNIGGCIKKNKGTVSLHQ